MIIKYKKAIHPVVAVSLLLVVSVVAVVGFQGWFQTFSTSTILQVEQTSQNTKSELKVDGLINNQLYLNKLPTDNEIKKIEILDNSGNSICNLENENNLSNSISTSILGHWKFDNVSTTITDYSGNNNHGTLYGATKLLYDFDNNTLIDKTAFQFQASNFGATWQNSDCISQNCYSFDGDDYIKLENSSFFDFTQSKKFSLSLWVKPNNYGQQVLIRNSGGASDSGYMLEISAKNNQSMFYLIDDTGNTTNSQNHHSITAPITLNSWNHIVGTYADNEMKLYVNGVMLDSTTINFNFSTNTSYFSIGAIDRSNGIPGQFFNGSIDELSIYSRDLTSSDVLELYNSKKAKLIEFTNSNNGKAIEFRYDDSYIELATSSLINYQNHSIVTITKSYGSCSIYGEWSETDSHHIVHFAKGSDNIQSDPWPPGGAPNNYANYSSSEYNFYYTSQNANNLLLGANRDLLLNSSISQYYTGSSPVNRVWIGARPWITKPNNIYGTSYCDIDEIIVFDRPLSKQEIDEVYLSLINVNNKKINVESCNLEKNNKYSILINTDNQLIEQSIIVK